MVSAALPATKIAALLIKTIAKPVSKRIQHEFSKNKTTSKGLIWIGQMAHSIESRLTIWSAGYTVRTIHPLDDSIALKNGSEVIGETFVLVVSLGAVVWEYNRSKEKERIKEEKIQYIAQQERYELQNKLIALDTRLHALEVVVQANSESLLNYIKRGPKYIPPKDIVSIRDDHNDEVAIKQQQQQQQQDNDNNNDSTDESINTNEKSLWRRWLWPF